MHLSFFQLFKVTTLWNLILKSTITSAAVVIGKTNQEDIERFHSQRELEGHCPVKEFFGSTLYVPAFGSCLKIELFPNGFLSLDMSDSSCSSTENSGTVMSAFGSISPTDDYVTFKTIKGKGLSGKVYFKEDPSLSEVTVNPINLDRDTKQFIVELVFPSCDMGPTYPCFIGDIFPKTLYVPFKPLSACVRLDISKEGTLSVEKFSDCSDSSSFAPDKTLSLLTMGHGNTLQYSPFETDGYSGVVTVFADKNAKKNTFSINSGSLTEGTFDLTLTVPYHVCFKTDTEF